MEALERLHKRLSIDPDKFSRLILSFASPTPKHLTGLALVPDTKSGPELSTRVKILRWYPAELRFDDSFRLERTLRPTPSYSVSAPV